MRCTRPVILSVICILVAIPAMAQETITPTPVPPELAATQPFSYNGLIIASGVYGSGTMIGEGVMATAGHVAYDDTNFQWLAPSLIHYYPQSDTNSTGFGRTKYAPIALYGWTSYSGDSYHTRLQGDDEGFPTPNTFNLDFVVGYFSSSINENTITMHSEINVDSEGKPSILRRPYDKMIVGYPQDADFIEPANQGLMHYTEPGDYKAENAIFNFEQEGYDFGGIWAAIQKLYGVTTYSGNSGGPVYIKDYLKDEIDNWLISGIIVGREGSGTMFIRAIDENAWEWIQQAVVARNQNSLVRVNDQYVDGSSDGHVKISWSDQSTEEAGYLVFRQENGIYSEIAVLSPNSNTFVDNDVDSGQVYHYMIQPFKTLSGNRAPRSKPISVETGGSYNIARNHLNLNWLQISSSGDSSWFVDESNRLRAGIIGSMEKSSLVLEIMGPGKIDFDWSVSSEVNPGYLLPVDNHPVGVVYDAIWLYIDDQIITIDNEPVFLSGPSSDDLTGMLSETGIQLFIPEGPHKIEWRYQKDPYANHHLDTGFLDSMSWTPDAGAGYPIYGAYGIAESTWHASGWFGRYEAKHWPWIAHENMGWLYVLGGTSSSGLYIHCDDARLGTMYTSPHIWPFLYRSASGSWVYYRRDSGNFGQGAVFWDFDAGQHIVTGI